MLEFVKAILALWAIMGFFYASLTKNKPINSKKEALKETIISGPIMWIGLIIIKPFYSKQKNKVIPGE